MIGIVIVTHGDLGKVALEQATTIAGEMQAVRAVGVSPDATPDAVREELAAAIKAVDTGKGVLVLTDMFGGTPSNLSLSFLDEHPRLEVLSGINLPMLLKLVTARTEEASLEDVSGELKAAGRKNIALAREILAIPGRAGKAKAQ